MSGKLDASGKYRQFPGTTVVAEVVFEVAEWSAIEAFVRNSRLKDFYAALPWQSFHVTVCGVGTFQHVFGREYEEVRDSADWLGFLQKNEELHMEMAAKAAAFAMPLPRFVGAGVDGRILSARFEFVDEKPVRVFSASIKCQPSIPSHMTIAYQTKKLPDNDEALKRDTERLSELVSKLFQSAQQKTWLKRAAFCYFDSMLHFEPWSGTMQDFPGVLEACKKVIN
jgi:hypothetical protein